MKKIDWTLLAIAAGKERGLTPVQLQKSLFLLGEKYRKSVGRKFYDFVPYNYGPFDPAIYRDAEELVEKKFIIIERSGRSWPEYLITKAGLEHVDEILQDAPTSAVEYIDRTVKWAQSLSFSELLRSIYAHYPKYRTNSVFQDRS